MADSKEKTIASKELRTIYEELQQSQQSLQKLYEESWNATLQFKTTFNEIKTAENETEALRQQYYQMLERHGKYEETDRDDYFTMERNLADMKDRYIAESQKLALGNSNYIAYSNTFSEQREKYIRSLLQDVDSYFSANAKLSAQKSELEKTSAQLSKEVCAFKVSVSQLTNERSILLKNEGQLKEECDASTKRGNDLSDECDRLTKVEDDLRGTVHGLKTTVASLTREIEQLTCTCESLSDQVEKYSAQEIVLNEDILQRKKDQEQKEKEITDLKKKSADLLKQKNATAERNYQLTQKVAACRLATGKVEEQRDLFKEAFKQIKKEKKEIAQNCEKIKKEKEKFKDQFVEMRSERQLVGKQKDLFVSKEHKTREQNNDMTTAHKYLVKELEEVKLTYRKSEERAKKDAKLKQDLRDAIKRVRREMEEERKKWQKETRDVKIQTDSDLACENRDIVILHAKLKLNQALKERDRALSEQKQRRCAKCS